MAVVAAVVLWSCDIAVVTWHGGSGSGHVVLCHCGSSRVASQWSHGIAVVPVVMVCCITVAAVAVMLQQSCGRAVVPVVVLRWSHGMVLVVVVVSRWSCSRQWWCIVVR